ncbi:hypothetical protein [uncultured Cetobacterium sp.]|uniref:hypothetical protein n=1 Tax=uncultured Cetobacterium sp. TaxID=527638 RepID=UPI00260B4C7F|nr:hypothetical protein [uncultured Cetobacterium sp.]
MKKEIIDELIDEKIIKNPHDEMIDLDLIEELEDSEHLQVEEQEKHNDVTARDLNLNKDSDFNIDEYVQENYSFEEIDMMSLEEFIEEELKKPQIQSLKILIESNQHISNSPTFEEIMNFKKTHGGIFVIVIGLDFEEEVFGIPKETFICKTIKDKDYTEIFKKNNDAEEDFEFMKKELISRSVLFPPIKSSDVDRLKIGIVDVLLPAILKHSRFTTSHKIIRL